MPSTEQDLQLCYFLFVLKWSERCSVVSDSCDPIAYTVHGILQARILEWVAVPFSRGFSQPRDQTQVFHIVGKFFTSWATREAPLVTFSSVQFSSVAQLCPILCNPMDYSLPGFSFHEILQARILEWLAVPFSRGFSQPRDHNQFCIAGEFFTIWATREA